MNTASPSAERDDAPQTAAAGSVIIGAIPARYGSTRLPGKPLIDIAGKPMIEHVYRRAEQAHNLDHVVVLTDDERIDAAVQRFGGRCLMTPAHCASGTDRIAYAARAWAAAAVINIQGDEPLIDPQVIDRVALHLAAVPTDPVVTLAAPTTAAAAETPDIVKVVLDRRGYALYFSRARIPFPRHSGAEVLQHIGLYGYQRDALLELASLAPTPLEQSESLEQLRVLENGMSIRVLRVQSAEPGVDTEEDVARVRARLAAQP